MRWTAEDKEKLRVLYPHKSNRELGAMFGCSMDAVRKAAEAAGAEGKTAATLLRNRVQLFEKGRVPHNLRPLFAIRENRIGNRIKNNVRLEIKIAEPDVWKPLSHIVWEVFRMGGWFSEKSRIPGVVIRHKDGDPLNCRIDNLEGLSVRDNLIKNTGDFLSDAIVNLYLNMATKDDRIDYSKELLELKRNELRLRREIQRLIKN
jgi:hypothetical protein